MLQRLSRWITKRLSFLDGSGRFSVQRAFVALLILGIVNFGLRVFFQQNSAEAQKYHDASSIYERVSTELYHNFSKTVFEARVLEATVQACRVQNIRAAKFNRYSMGRGTEIRDPICEPWWFWTEEQREKANRHNIHINFDNPCLFMNDELGRKDEDEARMVLPMTFVAVFSGRGDRDVARRHFYASPFLQAGTQHEVVEIDNYPGGFRNPSALYNQAIRESRTKYVVFVHPDVYLPGNWIVLVDHELENLEDRHPDWAVVGMAGNSGMRVIDVGLEGQWRMLFEGGDYPIMAESIFDESIMIFRGGSEGHFDPIAPNHHNLAAMVALDTREAGKFHSYVFPRIGYCHKVGGPFPYEIKDMHRGKEIAIRYFACKYANDTSVFPRPILSWTIELSDATNCEDFSQSLMLSKDLDPIFALLGVEK